MAEGPNSLPGRVHRSVYISGLLVTQAHNNHAKDMLSTDAQTKSTLFSLFEKYLYL